MFNLTAKRLFFYGICFLGATSLISFGAGKVVSDERPFETKIGDHVRIATDLDDTLVTLPSSVVFRFHKSAKKFDDQISDELLNQIGQKYKEKYGSKKKFVKISLDPLSIKFLKKSDFEKESKKNGMESNTFFINLISTDEYADLKNEATPHFYFNEKSFYRSRSDKALLEDVNFRFEEGDSYQMARRLSSSNIPLEEVFSLITAREHSEKSLVDAIGVLFGKKRVMTEQNIHPLNNKSYLNRCSINRHTSMPQRKATTILTILDDLKKARTHADGKPPVIKHPCYPIKQARNYKVFQFFDDDRDNIQGVLNSLKDSKNFTSYNQYEDVIVIIRKVGKTKRNYAVCKGL